MQKKLFKALLAKHTVHAEILFIAAVLIISALIRLNFVLNMNHEPLGGDAKNYDLMVRQFLTRGFLGYMSDKPNAYITPGYPIFLSLIYLVFGYEDASPLMEVRVIQAVLGALTCVLMYFIGKKLKNRIVGAVAATSYAIYPVYAWSPSLILTETLYNFVFLLYFYIQLLILEKGGRRLSFINGVIFGIAVLIRPLAFPFLILPFAYQYFSSKDVKYLKLFMWSAAGMTVIMLPWWIRNIATLNRLIILCTQGGNPFLGGVSPYFTNTNLAAYASDNQTVRAFNLLIEGMKEHPVLYIKWFTIGKFDHMFRNIWFYPTEGFTFLSSLKLFHYVIVVMGWVGAVYSLIRDKLRLISVYAFFMTALYLLFIPEPRYAYYIFPFLIILMSNLLYVIFKKT